MPHFNNQTYSSPSSRLETARRPFREESLLDIFASPFNPDPTVYIDSTPQWSSPRTPPFQVANSSYPYSPILPLTSSPSQPVTTSSIPPDCFEEFIIHPPYKDKKPGLNKWGGIIDFLPIKISDNNHALGTPMRDCLRGFGLKDPDQRLFESLADTGKPHIEFMIMWPGYPQLDWIVPISIYGSDSLLVTKREFAHRIAVQYQNFALMCELSQMECQNPRWRVGPGGYTFDRMRLSMLHWVDGDIWQAHIRVLTDRDVDPNGLKPMRDISQR